MYYITPKCALTQEFRQKVPKTIRLREKNLYKPRFCLYDYSIQSRIYECDYDV